jgi:hypothetical protein
MIETTTDCLERAHDILKQAEKVKTREDHASVWDQKAELLNVINSAFETGYFTGEAYDELKKAKRLLYQAEIIAGKKSKETYASK